MKNCANLNVKLLNQIVKQGVLGLDVMVELGLHLGHRAFPASGRMIFNQIFYQNLVLNVIVLEFWSHQNIFSGHAEEETFKEKGRKGIGQFWGKNLSYGS